MKKTELEFVTVARPRSWPLACLLRGGLAARARRRDPFGRFDAADEDQAALVLDAAEALILTLHNSEDPKRCPTLRVSTDDTMQHVLMRWEHSGGWRDAVTGEPC